MRKLAQSAILAAVAIVVMSASSVYAQKIGVVDINAVVTALPEYQTANAKIQALTKQYEDTMETMRTQYQAAAATAQKLGETATPEFKAKEAAMLDSMQTVYGKFQESKFGQQGEIAQTQASLMKPITDKLQTALESYAKKERLSVIFPKTATVYDDPSIDYTTKFQDYLKAQAAK